MMFLGTLDKICQHKHFKSIANQLYTRQEEIEQKSSSRKINEMFNLKNVLKNLKKCINDLF